MPTEQTIDPVGEDVSQDADPPSEADPPGGYREALRVAIPLTVSAGTWSVQVLVDRVFLTWYSDQAIAASLPAALLYGTVASLFFGTINYSTVFVAQYHGAGRPDRIGSTIWQGFYISLIASCLLATLIPFAGSVFRWAGHPPGVVALENSYFQILCLSVGPHCVAVTASRFFVGRGRTVVAMWLEGAAVGANIVLDYGLIFGNWGMPRMGIRGAGWATFGAYTFLACAYLALLLRRANRETYRTLTGWRLDRPLIARMIRFGGPQGITASFAIMGLAAFTLILGRLGTIPLAANNVLSTLALVMFLPVMGMSQSVGVLAGRYMGKKRPDIAARSTWSAYKLTLGYVLAACLFCALFPDLALAPFSAGADPVSYPPIHRLSKVLLWFLVGLAIFDATGFIFSAAISAAGDTRFVMFSLTAMTWVVMILPSYLAVVQFDRGIIVAFIFRSALVFLVGPVFLGRFLGGKWRTMQVIEPWAAT